MATAVLSKVDAFIRTTGMKPSRLGREAVGDPRLVYDLRRGRELRPATARRLSFYVGTRLDGHRAEQQPCAESRLAYALGLLLSDYNEAVELAASDGRIAALRDRLAMHLAESGVDVAARTFTPVWGGAARPIAPIASACRV